MTEPVRIKIGNVSFRQKDIKSYSVNFQNDEKINSVLLNNGTKITFKDQEAGNKSVNCGRLRDGEIYNMTNFFGIKGLTIEGSKENDAYRLYSCEDYNIDTRGGKKDQIILIDSSRGTIKADENDITTNSSRKTPIKDNEIYTRMKK